MAVGLPDRVAVAEESPRAWQATLSLDDPRIKTLEQLARSHGIVQGLPVKPWTLGQTISFLDRLENHKGLDSVWAELGGWNSGLTQPEKALLEKIRASLLAPRDLEESGFSLEASLALHPELYLHTFQVAAGESAFWEYGYKERNPVFNLGIDAAWSLAESRDSQFYGFAGTMDLDLREDQNLVDMYLDPSRTGNISNLPEDGTYIDFQFPHRTFVALGGANWDAMTGRERMSLGNGRQGNLGISDSPDFYDFARVQFLSTWFNYTGLWINLEPSLSGLENLAPTVSYEEAKNIFVHRFDLDFWDTFHFGFTEGMLVGGVQPTIEYLSPFMTLHNYYPWLDGNGFISASAFLGLEATLSPVRGLNLWFQYGQNQFQTDFETANYGNAAAVIPNAWGMMAGGEFTWNLGSGEVGTDGGTGTGTDPGPGTGAGSPTASGTSGAGLPWFLSFGGEWVYTNPWFYVRENGMNSWFWRRRLVSNVAGGDQFVTKPVGWELGPDSQSFCTWVELSRYDLLSLRLEGIWRQKGEQELTSVYSESLANAAMVTPTGVPEESWILGLGGEVVLLPGVPGDRSWTPRLGANWDLRYVYSTNAGHHSGATREDFQVVLGFSVAW